MNKIPNEQKEMVRSILIEESLSLNEKMTALEDTMLDWQTLKDGMKLLVNMVGFKVLSPLPTDIHRKKPLRCGITKLSNLVP